MDLGVRARDEVVGEDLGRFHGPECLAIKGAQHAFAAVFLDGVCHAMCEHDGVFAANNFQEGDELFGLHEGPGAVVDEDIVDAGRQRFDGVGHRVLAFLAALHEDRGSRRVAHELVELGGIAVDDRVVIGDATALERGDGVGEHGAASEGFEDFVGDGALHTGAGAGGEEDDCDAAHKWGGVTAGVV